MGFESVLQKVGALLKHVRRMYVIRCTFHQEAQSGLEDLAPEVRAPEAGRCMHLRAACLQQELLFSAA